MQLPAVKQRVCLAADIYKDDPAEAWEEAGVTDVTVLARDLEEGIWTVWDHTDRCLKMIYFDENSNWSWVEASPEVTDDQS